MKSFLSQPFFKRFGKKALLIYLGWSIVKGIILLAVGFRWLD